MEHRGGNKSPFYPSPRENFCNQEEEKREQCSVQIKALLLPFKLNANASLLQLLSNSHAQYKL
jgi:hypothetical protein